MATMLNIKKSFYINWIKSTAIFCIIFVSFAVIMVGSFSISMLEYNTSVGNDNLTKIISTPQTGLVCTTAVLTGTEDQLLTGSYKDYKGKLHSILINKDLIKINTTVLTVIYKADDPDVCTYALAYETQINFLILTVISIIMLIVYFALIPRRLYRIKGLNKKNLILVKGRVEQTVFVEDEKTILKTVFLPLFRPMCLKLSYIDSEGRRQFVLTHEYYVNRLTTDMGYNAGDPVDFWLDLNTFKAILK